MNYISEIARILTVYRRELDFSLNPISESIEVHITDSKLEDEVEIITVLLAKPPRTF